MFAVIRTGGKQYRVAESDMLKIEKLNGEAGQDVLFSDVLMVGEQGKARIGNPLVEGASVAAEIVEQTRAAKVLSFKKRRRKNSRRIRGHRQLLTLVRIREILTDGKKPSAKKAKPPEKKEKAPVEEAKEAKQTKQTKPSAKESKQTAKAKPSAKTAEKKASPSSAKQKQTKPSAKSSAKAKPAAKESKPSAKPKQAKAKTKPSAAKAAKPSAAKAKPKPSAKKTPTKSASGKARK